MEYNEDQIYKDNAAWLAEGLSKKGKSRQVLADRCGVSKQTVFKWIKSEKPGRISNEKLLRAAEYLECGLPDWMQQAIRDSGYAIPGGIPNQVKEAASALSEFSTEDMELVLSMIRRISSTAK